MGMQCANSPFLQSVLDIKMVLSYKPDFKIVSIFHMFYV